MRRTLVCHRLCLGSIVRIALLVCAIGWASTALAVTGVYRKATGTAAPALPKSILLNVITAPQVETPVGFPVTTGVPFADGQLATRDLERLRIIDDRGQTVPAQFSARGVYPHSGNVRWLGIDFQIAPAVEHYRLEFAGGPPAPHRSAIHVDSSGPKLVVSTGDLTAEIPKRGGMLGRVWLGGKLMIEQGEADGNWFTSRDGTRYDEVHARDVRAVVERGGPLHTVIRVDGRYADGRGTDACRWTARLHFHAGQPLIHIVHTFTWMGRADRFGIRDLAISFGLAQSAQAAAADRSDDTVGDWVTRPPSGNRVSLFEFLIEHALFHYYLTGDQRSLDVAREYAAALKACIQSDPDWARNFVARMNNSLSRWFFQRLEELAILYEQFGDPWFERKASELFELAIDLSDSSGIRREKAHGARRAGTTTAGGESARREPDRAAPPLELVAAGKPRAVIVVGAGATPALGNAVRELRDDIAQVSGVRLPVVPEDKLSAGRSATVIIAVGGTRLAAKAGLHVVSSDPEAFRIVRRGNTLYLLGSDSPPYERFFKSSLGSGIEYAVYEFLERVCEIRWLRPGAAGTFVPHKSTLTVGDIDIEQAPSYQYRFMNYWYEGKAARILGTPEWKQRAKRQTDELHEWMKHNKMNDCRVIPGGHAFVKIVPKTEYAKHPDYFALVKGSRKPGGTHHSGWQLCTTNPGVIDRAVQYARRRFRSGALVVSITPNDGMGFCECERCRALDDPNWKDERGRVVLSNRIATFVNEVARRLKDEFPDQFVGSESYSRYKEPPRGIQFEPNVMLWLTNRQYYNWVPGRREKFYAFYEKWRSVQPHVFVLSSEFLTDQFRWGTPWAILPLDAEVIRWAGQQTQFTTRSGPAAIQNDWGNNGILYYTTARLLWNSRQDPNVLMHDYCTTMYGLAAAPMRKYWDRLAEGERDWQQRLKEQPRGINVVFQMPEFHSRTVRHDCRDLLRRAATLAETSWSQANVAFSTKGFEYTDMTTHGIETYLQLFRATTKAEMERLTGDLRSTWARRRALIEAQRDENIVGYGQFQLMVLNAAKFGAQQSHEQHFAFFETIEPEKLQNPDLEQPLWGNWYRFPWGPEARWTTRQAHAGRRSVSIVGNGSVGQFLALVPGRKYRLTGWVRTDGVRSAGIRVYSFKQPAFMWLYRLALQRWQMTTRAGKRFITGSSPWQPVACEIVPKAAVVLIECFNNDTGEAFFDDFTLEPAGR